MLKTFTVYLFFMIIRFYRDGSGDYATLSFEFKRWEFEVKLQRHLHFHKDTYTLEHSIGKRHEDNPRICQKFEIRKTYA